MSKISIVIPVYNEGKRIGACLEAIAAQTVRPYEVIVVDNNSTDNTRAIVSKYPFAKLMTAKRQGVVHARNRGFNAVRGDLIGRIDADTRLPRDWTARVEQIFETTAVDAVTGSISYYDIPHRRLFGRIDLLLRRRAARLMQDEVFLQGANMAIRRTAWRAVRGHLCLRGGLHEDFDLAIHLSQAERVVTFDQSLHAAISARCIDDSFRDFLSYVLLNPGTYAQHELRSGRHMYPIVVLVLLFHFPMKLLYRGYDTDTRAFSLAHAFRNSLERVNPATHVD